jgi:hypothetical protein
LAACFGFQRVSGHFVASASQQVSAMFHGPLTTDLVPSMKFTAKSKGPYGRLPGEAFFASLYSVWQIRIINH